MPGPGLIEAAIGAALAWLGRADALPPTQLVALGIADLNPANIIWDGQTCRLVDFEDGGLTDLAYELADHTEHIAGRLGRPGRTGPVARRILDPEALVDAVGLSLEERERMHRYRPLWAAFWLAMLLPGNGGFRRNPLANVPLPGRPFRGARSGAKMFSCRPVTPCLYASSRASTSRARGSRCGPFIVADAVVEHED